MFSLVWKIYYGSYLNALLLVMASALAGSVLTLLYEYCRKFPDIAKAQRIQKLFMSGYALILAVCAMFLLWITVFGRTFGLLRVIHLIPGRLFLEYLNGDMQSLRTLLMNIGMFTPVGILLGMCFQLNGRKQWKSRRQVFIVLLSALFFSLLLEAGQFVCACGETDVEDVLMNVLGAIIGFGIFRLELFILRHLLRLQTGADPAC